MQKLNPVLGEAMTHIATYRLSAFPRGAEVFVDGASQGHAPLSGPVLVAPGQHQIRITLTGHTEQTREPRPRSRTHLG